MPIRFLLSRSNRTRFLSVLRREGPGAAVRRGFAYVWLRLRLRLGFAQTRPDEVYLSSFWSDMARNDAFHVTPAPALVLTQPRIAMIGDLNLPQCRKYRVEQQAELWGAQQVGYDFAHYADVPRSVALLQNATHLMLYRTQNDPRMCMYLYEARRLGLPVLYDLDDPLFSVSAYETYENMKALDPGMKAHFLSEAPKYLGAMNLADLITVSTPGMVAHTRLYTSRPVHFRRNFADAETLEAGTAACRVAGRAEGAPFRVAFASGSMGHEVDFALIADDIVGFLDAAPDRELVILGHFDTSLLPEDLRSRVETHLFSTYDLYLEALSTVDCAVMPLTDDIFNRCKSAVRVLDASAVAVPSLVGTVSDMAQVVRDGQTGRVLGPDGDSWRAALEDLAADRAATRVMGLAARAELERTWTARIALPVVEQAVVDWVKG